MKRLYLVAALAGAALFWPGASRLHATVVLPAELHELVAEARTIVHGRVVGTESRLVEGERTIETVVTLAAREYLKGALGPQVTVRVPGGQIGDRRYVMMGAPVLRPGDDVVLFLGGSGPAVPWILGLNQGVYRVRTGARAVTAPGRFGDEMRIVERDREHVRSASSGPVDPMTLGAFKARIRELAGGAR